MTRKMERKGRRRNEAKGSPSFDRRNLVEGRVLWAPWRMAYIEKEKLQKCIFCIDIVEDRWRDYLILTATASSLVMLNKFPYNNGHLLIAPHRHIAKLEKLSAKEFSDLMAVMRQAVAVVSQALHPQGINLGMNLGKCAGAGVEDHLHWHIVPRWEGDNNFMPVVGEVRVMPQHLLESYDRLQPFFSDFPALVRS
jgi:ATP adenylyltransferase